MSCSRIQHSDASEARTCFNSLTTEKFCMFFFVGFYFFSRSIFFLKNSFRNTIRVSNSLDPGQASHFVTSGLGPNCLERLSADVTSS